MSLRILILYATSYGQTAKVARYITDCLTRSGCSVRLVHADQLPAGLSPRGFDGVLIGASVIVGRHKASVRRFAKEHRDELNAMPSAFFSVSGSAGSHDARGKIDAQRCIDDFLRETGWRPVLTESIAGAMAFTKYNPIVRWVLKQISKRNGGPTDTSCDHELTDWPEVEQFAGAFMTMVNGGTAASVL